MILNTFTCKRCGEVFSYNDYVNGRCGPCHGRLISEGRQRAKIARMGPPGLTDFEKELLGINKRPRN
jgi:hypothetical protein